MDIKLEFRWSEKARRAYALATGENAPGYGEVVVSTGDMTPDERALFADKDGDYKVKDILFVSYAYNGWGMEIRGNQAVLDTAPTLAEVIAARRAALVSWDIEAAKRDERQAEDKRQKDASHAAEVERRRIAAEIEEHNKAAAEAKATRDRAEMETWISANGSERLRKAFAGGYRVDRLYAEERAAIEYPGFAYDGDNLAGWNDRVGPSLAALDLAEATAAAHPAATVKIVWLTAPVRKIEYDDFVECEAVAVDDPNYKRWLVREM